MTDTIVESFSRACEHMAAALAFARPARTGWCRLRTLGPFDAAAPYTSAFIGTTRDVLDAERGMILGDVTPDDLAQPVQYAALSTLTDAPGYCAIAARRATWHELRGLRVPFVSRHHCVVSLAEIYAKGTYEAASRMCSWHARERRWLTWDATTPPHADGIFDRRMWLLTGGQFTARYEWHVLLGFPDAPRIAIPCSAEEARVLFASRDLPDGAERRAALRHWVEAHYRSRHDGEPIYVRAHLRGATEFTFDDLVCTLVPSAYDQQRARAQPASVVE